MDARAEGPVLFFDGVCNLCNGAVQFVIRHDAAGKIRFASLQSPAGEQAKKAVEKRFGSVPDSLILLQNGEYHILSDAALRVAALLDGRWRLLSGLRIVPRFLRNAVYKLIAGNRYRIWGKKDACTIPTPALKGRFIS